MSATPQMDGRSWLMLVAVSIIWAGSFLLTEIALRDVPPLSIMTARVTIGALGLYVMMRWAGARFSPAHDVSTVVLLVAFLVLGLMNNVVPFSLIVWGQTHLSASLASILNATMPLFTIFLAHFFTTDEKLTLNKLLGILIGLVGVGFIVGHDGIDFTHGTTLGKFAVLGAACSYAVAALIARRFARLRLDPLFVAFGQSAAAALIAVPLSLYVDKPWTLEVTPAGWMSLVALGLICSSVAYALYFRLIAVAGATNASLVTLLIPPFAIVSGVALMGDRLSLVQLGGMALILMALLVTDGRLFSGLHRQGT